MSFLEIKSISSIVDGRVQLQDINFTQYRLQKLAITGATGSGKTTLLKIIGGLIQPSEGSVYFEGIRVKGPDEKLLPGHPQIAYLSQHFELRNNYRVEELLEMANQFSASKASNIYALCRIDHLLKRWTNQLSGGEKQRIVLAGLLTTAPKLLLLDEPFSNLDAIHKNILKSVINDIGEELNLTCILVAHEPYDTLSWADEIIVLREGKIIQKGTANDIYHHPVDDYAASLFGNFTNLPLSLIQAFKLPVTNKYFRPSDFVITNNANNAIQGTIKNVRFMGSIYEAVILIDNTLITVHTFDKTLKRGDRVSVTCKRQEINND